MSIKKTFNGATIIKPGAYSRIIVENLTGFPLQPTGIVGIVGEAVGGEPRVLDVLSSTQIQDAKARYKSGPIADALELLVNPSKDPRVANGASTIVVYKVNNSTQATLDLNSDLALPLLNMTTKNYGEDENQVNLLVSEGSIADQNAKIEGAVTGDFTLAGGETLIVKVNNVNYTFTNTLTGVTTAAALVVEMMDAGKWAPSRPIITTQDAGILSIEIDTVAIASSKLDYGYIQIDATSTLDTIVGLTGAARGIKGTRVFVTKKGTSEEVSLELGGTPQISVKYVGAGTLAKLSLSKTLGEVRLTTEITGQPTHNLNILLEDASGVPQLSMKGLVDLINSNTNYQASVVGDGGRNANELDFYNEIIFNEQAVLLSADLKAYIDYFNVLSSFIGAEKVVNSYGALATYATPIFFSGATAGTMANIDWANGFEALKDERINHVVPLISEDKSGVTIDSVNALCDSHVKWGWSTTGKSERNAYVSKLGTKTELKDAAKTLNSGYTSICGQEVQVVNRFGDFVWLRPWGMACILAGLDAGSGIGEPITFKFINVNNIRVNDGSWSPKKDYPEMIDAGVTFAEAVDSGGFRCVVGNTTYGIDASFVWNRISVVEAAGFVAYDLRFNLELVFTGTKARTGTAEAVANFIKSRMTVYLGEDIIVGDDLNEGLGYKDLRVLVEGNTAKINISVTPVQGIDFILPTIYLADIKQSA